ncbi:MAG: type II secretion system protein M [Acidiferrobacterales bacterium]|nr:type II secretion system protein M [Acidiferrobacterales bacterium]
MKNIIVTYWQQLERREQLILALGGLIVSFILFYALILKPWHRALNEMSERIPTQRENLVWMRQMSEIVKNGGDLNTVATAKDTNKSLIAIVNQTARSSRMNNFIQQIVPGNNLRTNADQVNVVLEEADFNQWVRWVDDLSNNYSVNIGQLSVESETDEPNIVELRVTFERD